MSSDRPASKPDPNGDRRGRGRWQLAALFLIFALPVVVAWVIYATRDDWTPAEATAAGALVHPARPAPELALTAADGTTISLEALVADDWTLLVHAPEGCARDCRDRLQVLANTRLALGEDMHRGALALILGPGAPLPEQAALPPGLQTARLPDAGAAQALGSWLAPPAGAPAAEQGIYLVDPLGNLMMYYAPGEDPKGILRDLRRLLKASRIG